ncbi:hypothetical protein EIN_495990 [Entamoeba invadens IP1]|uniref:Uncharacterized protein n=1 Tax=Entamoeba invadens IP1 TaxID=370355 RepID=A0A0A1TZS4_ENTIV|nr:hypothetical protein EIN_495990 [Entamoeba invadens IP1]ELP87114.1 hypothetical protein EIN_495990 [Entamoeba invadens IP1]|eukprot:XP_004253885.1 hypothetical protein EIN_495990 [Entamoeba invadens IP1]
MEKTTLCEKEVMRKYYGQQERVRKRMNFEASLISYILALITDDVELEICQPHTYATKTVPFVNIKTLTIDGDQLDFQKFLFDHLEERALYDKKEGVIEKTVTRRTQTRRRKDTIYFFEDILFEKRKCIIQRINSTTFVVQLTNDNFPIVIATKQDILVFGSKIAYAINQKVKKEKIYKIAKGELGEFI